VSNASQRQDDGRGKPPVDGVGGEPLSQPLERWGSENFPQEKLLGDVEGPGGGKILIEEGRFPFRGALGVGGAGRGNAVLGGREKGGGHKGHRNRFLLPGNDRNELQE